MKKLYFIALSAAFFLGCNESKTEIQKQAPDVKKSAVIFYSQTGTTQKVAAEFAKQLNAETFELKMETPYPSTYDSTVAAVIQEIQTQKWPALANAKIDFSAFDTLYIGYPIMAGTFAPAIYTFLDSNDLSGKVLVPFCTYGSAGRKESAEDIRKHEPNAKVLRSFGIAHNRIQNASVNLSEEVAQFIAAIRSETEEAEFVGAYSEARTLTAEDSAVFAKATKDYAYLKLEPTSVQSQVVAGTNYLFICNMQEFGVPKTGVKVKIFSPLPGQGEPQFIELEK